VSVKPQKIKCPGFNWAKKLLSGPSKVNYFIYFKPIILFTLRQLFYLFYVNNFNYFTLVILFILY